MMLNRTEARSLRFCALSVAKISDLENLRASAMCTTVNAMSGPHYINENQSDIRGVKPGWYMSGNDGNLYSGPFSSQQECHGRAARPMKGLEPSQSRLKAKPATLEADRLTEDEVAREKN
jgi:hypothetical protein